MILDDVSLIVFVGGIYLIAGTIKGLLGLGLPTTALTLMTFILSPIQALSINLIPMFVANIWQLSRAENIRRVVTTYAYFAISLSLSIFAFSFLTVRLSTAMLQLAVASSVILFSLYNLSQRPIPLSPERDKLWQILFGFAAGVIGALTSMWAVPLVIYLLSKNLTPRAFVEAAGFLLLVGCLPLSVGYIVTGLITIDILYPALAGIIAALLGFQIGAHVRQKIDGALFRRILLWFFFVMGMRMLLVALSSI